eukprot:g6140.t1
MSKWNALRSSKTRTKLKLASALDITADLTPDELCSRSIALEKECISQVTQLRKRLKKINSKWDNSFKKKLPTSDHDREIILSWFTKELERRQRIGDVTTEIAEWLRDYKRRNKDIVRIDKGEEEKEIESGNEKKDIDEEISKVEVDPDVVMRAFHDSTAEAEILIQEGAGALSALSSTHATLLPRLMNAAKGLQEQTSQAKKELMLISGETVPDSTNLSEREKLHAAETFKSQKKLYNRLRKEYDLSLLQHKQAEIELAAIEESYQKQLSEELTEKQNLLAEEKRLKNLLESCKARLESENFRKNMRAASRAQGKDDGGADRSLMSDMEALARLEKLQPKLREAVEKERLAKQAQKNSAHDYASTKRTFEEEETAWMEIEKTLLTELRELNNTTNEKVASIEKEAEDEIGVVMKHLRSAEAEFAEFESVKNASIAAAKKEAEMYDKEAREIEKAMRDKYLAPYLSKLANANKLVNEAKERKSVLPAMIKSALVSHEKTIEHVDFLDELAHGNAEEVAAEAEMEADADAEYYEMNPPDEDAPPCLLLARNERENVVCMAERDTARDALASISVKVEEVKKILMRLKKYEDGSAGLVSLDELYQAEQDVIDLTENLAKAKQKRIEEIRIEQKERRESQVRSNRQCWKQCSEAQLNFILAERKSIQAEVQSFKQHLSSLIESCGRVEHADFITTKEAKLISAVQNAFIKDISENKNEGSNVSENAARIALQRNPSGKLMLSLRGESGFPHTVASPIRHILIKLASVLGKSNTNGLLSNFENLAKPLVETAISTGKFKNILTENVIHYSNEVSPSAQFCIAQNLRVQQWMKLKDCTKRLYECYKSRLHRQLELRKLYKEVLNSAEEDEDKFDFLVAIGIDKKDDHTKNSGESVLGSLRPSMSNFSMVRNSSCTTGPDPELVKTKTEIQATRESVKIEDTRMKSLRMMLKNLEDLSSEDKLTPEELSFWNELMEATKFMKWTDSEGEKMVQLSKEKVVFDLGEKTKEKERAVRIPPVHQIGGPRQKDKKKTNVQWNPTRDRRARPIDSSKSAKSAKRSIVKKSSAKSSYKRDNSVRVSEAAVKVRRSVRQLARTRKLSRTKRRVLASADAMIAARVTRHNLEFAEANSIAIEEYVRSLHPGERPEIMTLRRRILETDLEKKIAAAELEKYEPIIESLCTRKNGAKEILQEIREVEKQLAAVAVAAVPRSQSLARYAVAINGQRALARLKVNYK